MSVSMEALHPAGENSALAALKQARLALANFVGLPVDQCTGGVFLSINEAIADAEADRSISRIASGLELEGVARAICKTQGLCKYIGNPCNTSRCTVTHETARAAIAASRPNWRQPS